VAGVQQVPASVHTSVPPHVAQVIVPPQLSLTAWHEGDATPAQVSLTQHA
jgi:hypothetical protein